MQHLRSADEPGEIVSVGRLVKAHHKNSAEVAVLVSDVVERRGIGRALIQRLIEFAGDKGLDFLTASYLAENQPLENLFRSCGFSFSDLDKPQIRRAELKLNANCRN